MSLYMRDLAVLNYAQGFTLWRYNGRTSKAAEIIAPGYFHDAEDMLMDGDMVAISASDGACIMVVGRAAHGVVTLAPMLNPVAGGA